MVGHGPVVEAGGDGAGRQGDLVEVGVGGRLVHVEHIPGSHQILYMHFGLQSLANTCIPHFSRYSAL